MAGTNSGTSGIGAKISGTAVRYRAASTGPADARGDATCANAPTPPATAADCPERRGVGLGEVLEQASHARGGRAEREREQGPAAPEVAAQRRRGGVRAHQAGAALVPDQAEHGGQRVADGGRRGHRRVLGRGLPGHLGRGDQVAVQDGLHDQAPLVPVCGKPGQKGGGGFSPDLPVPVGKPGLEGL